jgi:hypothetical protein
MVRSLTTLLVAATTLCVGCFSASAASTTFSFSGDSINFAGYSISGSFTTNGVFDGTANQYITNADITSLSFSIPAAGVSFSTAGVVTSDGAFYDSTSLPPTVVNGSGFLALSDDPLFLLAIQGSNAMGISLSFDTSVAIDYFVGTWTSAATATPVPAALPLFATGLAGLGWLARRKKQKQSAAVA